MAKMSKKMRDVQPKLESIKKKYPDDKRKQSEETMRIYKERGFDGVTVAEGAKWLHLPHIVGFTVVVQVAHHLVPNWTEVRTVALAERAAKRRGSN